MKIYSEEGSTVMEIFSMERDGNQITIKGKVFESIPMTAKIRPEEVRRGFNLLNFRLVWFLLTFIFRRSVAPEQMR